MIPSEAGKSQREGREFAEQKNNEAEWRDKIHKLSLVAYGEKVVAFSGGYDLSYILKDSANEEENIQYLFDALRYQTAFYGIVDYIGKAVKTQDKEEVISGERQVKKIISLCLDSLDMEWFGKNAFNSSNSILGQNFDVKYRSYRYDRILNLILDSNLEPADHVDKIYSLLRMLGKEEIRELFLKISGYLKCDKEMAEVFAWDPDKTESFIDEMVNSIGQLNPKDKINTVASLAQTKQGDLLLSKYGELKLDDKQTEQLFLILAKEDPESLFHNLENIDLKSFDRTAILDALFSSAPVSFLAYGKELKLSPKEQEMYLERLSKEQPVDFLKHYKELASYLRVSFQKIVPKWHDDALLELDNKKLGAVDIINNFYGADLSLTSKANEWTRNKMRESLGEVGALLLADMQSNFEQYANDKYRRPAIEFLKKSGIKAGFDDILFFSGYAIYAGEYDIKKSECHRALTTNENHVMTKASDDAQALIFEWYLKNRKNPDLHEEVFFPLDCKPPLRTEAEIKMANQFIAEELTAQEPLLGEVFGLIGRLPLSATERDEKTMAFIDKNPEDIFVMWEKPVFKFLSENSRERLLEVFLQKDPHVLAQHYHKIPLSNERKERQIFQDLIDKGIEPFSQFKKVAHLLPLLKNGMFWQLWSDDENAKNFRETLLKARSAVDEKTWSALLASKKYSISMLDWKLDSYLAFEKIIQKKESGIKKFILGDNTKSGHMSFLAMLGPDSIPRAEQILNQIEKYGIELGKKEKQKRRDRNYKFELYHNTEDQLFKLCFLLKMEPAEADKIINKIAKLSYGTLNYIHDADQLQFLLANLERISNLIQTKSVTKNSRLIEIIVMSANPAEKLVFLEKYSDILDNPLPIWNQLAKMSSELLLKSPIFTKSKLNNLNLPLGKDSYIWEGIPASEKDEIISKSIEDRGLYRAKMSDLTNSQMETFLKNRLEKGINYTVEQQESASARNAEFANQNSGNLVFPSGTLTHYSNQNSAGGILETGNLCGECLGFDSKEDSYPFHVDTIRLDEKVADKNVRSVLKDDRTKYGGEIMYFYPYRSESDYHQNEEYKVDSGHFNHFLIFGMLPRAELGGVVVMEDKNKEAELALFEKIKEEIIKNDIYVPVFDSQGSLLFSLEEFEEQWNKVKPYNSLAHLLVSEDYFEGLDIEQGGAHKYTLKEHSLRAQDAVMAYISNANLSKDEAEMVLAAARLHDIGKLVEGGVQEVSNVDKAREILGKTKYLGIEDKRKILKLIRNDELLGEILKGIDQDEHGFKMSKETKNKFVRFNEIFADSKEKLMVRAIYESDVKSIGGTEYEDWQVGEKLEFLFE